ncbi:MULTISPECIES: GT-D fold domain-containing glycosyltransferase [unclassified Glutamicibacter]|uniref:GT-D fold domain-containing glycosyltransferase n=1 Tax=unclassified Glutamicibacter TaxID=2627139 RepID=UPI0037F95C86
MFDRLRQAANRIFNVRIVNAKPIAVTLDPIVGPDQTQAKLLRQIHAELKTHRRELETIRLAVTSEVMQDVTAFHRKQVKTLLETLELLASTDVSMARFGDGEFRLMLLNDFNLRFQKNSPELQEDLRKVFVSRDANVLVGFPQLFRDAHWSGVYQELWPQLSQLTAMDRSYACAHITRPQAFSALGDRAVELWRQVWAGKKVAIVTGEGSRFDLIPELFDNLAGHEFIHSLPIDAYDDIDRVEALVSDSDCDLALVALGPAGGILAHRLAASGKRALDIGHLSNSYENVYKGAPRPEATAVITSSQISA